MFKALTIKTNRAIYGVLATMLALLCACSGGSNSTFVSQVAGSAPPGFKVSGTITPAINNRVDIDINDTARQQWGDANYETNNSFEFAQALPNVVRLIGFVSHEPAPNGQLSANYNSRTGATDPRDMYRLNLNQDQSIELEIANFKSGVNDVDLYLFDANSTEPGMPQAYILEAKATTLNAKETLTITRSGEYFLVVEAKAGINRYTLSINNQSFISSFAQRQQQSTDFVIDDAIVKYTTPALSSNKIAAKQSPQRAQLQKRVASKTAKKASASPYGSMAQAKIQTLDYIKQLQQQANTVFAEPNYYLNASAIPNDTRFDLQANLKQINLPISWDITTGTPANGDVIIAIIDTGVVFEHPDLNGQLLSSGYDMVSNVSLSLDGDGIDNDPSDPGDSNNSEIESSWHGSHVSGIAAANTNNQLGISGVSWGAKILPIRALGLDGKGTSYDLIQSLRYAAGLSNDSGSVPPQRADIINLSLGGKGSSQAEAELFNQLYQLGIIVIAAAGNDNSNTPDYPAAYNHVIAVSAVDYENNKAPYSNFGPHIDITAPGGNTNTDINNDGFPDGILSTWLDTSLGFANAQYRYTFYQGTSMASPHIAGVAALMKAVYPQLNASEFELALNNGQLSDDIGDSGKDELYGHGLINAYKAIEHALALSNNTAPSSRFAIPSLVNFGVQQQTQTVILQAVGDAPPHLAQVSGSPSWLTIQTDFDIANNILLKLTVNRDGLADASYNGQLLISLSNGNLIRLNISMIVGSSFDSDQADTGPLYVLLIDQNDSSQTYQFNAKLLNGVYHYQFDSVSEGEYQIIAGSDIDANSFIGEKGESFGGYPSFQRRNTIAVTQDIGGLNFNSQVLNQLDNQTGSKLAP